jgi:hypothetical protein
VVRASYSPKKQDSPRAGFLENREVWLLAWEEQYTVCFKRLNSDIYHFSE